MTVIKLHNTLTDKLEDFVPIKEGLVSLYTCGPTVYDYPHVGNWASYIYWDTLVRILNYSDFDVTRVLNITDVGHLISDADEGEDKLEKGARREGKTAQEIAKFYTEYFMQGMSRLNLIPPKYIAKATDYIPQQLDLVRSLKTNGYTYQLDDGIYFDTAKFPNYADFAHLKLEDLKAGARVEHNSAKHNTSDFALWKFTPIGTTRDMQWQTPADIYEGSNPPMGFPGWHLECSAIAMALLSKTIDIHTGGIDHIPVHHTNEIAQSEAATGQIFSHYWIHANHIKINGTKVSKSLGNGYTLEDLDKKGFSPLDLRMFILQGHYRSEGNFTFESLTAATNRLHNWRNIAAIRHQTYDTLEADSEKSSNDNNLQLYTTSQAVAEAIANDLGTPEALRIIDEAFSRIASVKSLAAIDQDSFNNLLHTIDALLGLELVASTPDINDDVKRLILRRKQAREKNDWNESDKLRAELLKLGIAVRDTAHDTIWEYK